MADTTDDDKTPKDPTLPVDDTNKPSDEKDPPKDPEPTLASDDLSDYGKRAGEAQGYKGVPNFYEDAYPRFAHFLYGIRQILQGVETIEQTTTDPTMMGLCDDIRTLCRRLRDKCHETVIDGDHPTIEAARNILIRDIDAATLKVLDKRFTEFYQDFTAPIPGVHIQKLEEILTDDTARHTWYFTDLTHRERCFVMAMAALESAPFHQVTQSARELEAALREDEPVPPANQPQLVNQTQPAEPPQPSSKLVARTYTKRQIIKGTERIFWEKPEMITQMLSFVADEGMSIGNEQKFIEILKQWAAEGANERSWRAARALAIIWWGKDQSNLQQIIREWATEQNIDRRFHAAVLLDGAYKAERSVAIRNDDENALANSTVLGWLKRWVRPQSNALLFRATLFAYGIIGRNWPMIALDGLENALQLIPRKTDANEQNIAVDVILTGVVNYAVIAWNGQIRPVLERLADITTQLVERPRGSATPRDLAQRSRQSESSLSFVLAAFFIIAATSLDGDTADATTAYELQKPMPEYPDIPDKNGQDILLAGMLSQPETAWRQHCITLLAAAIREKQSRPAFDLIERWAVIVWREPAFIELRSAYVNIAVAIAHQLAQWDQPEKAPYNKGSSIFQKKLEFWKGPESAHEKKPINRFAQKVLQALRKP